MEENQLALLLERYFCYLASSVLMDGFCKTACWEIPKPLRFTLRVSCAFYKNAEADS